MNTDRIIFLVSTPSTTSKEMVQTFEEFDAFMQKHDATVVYKVKEYSPASERFVTTKKSHFLRVMARWNQEIGEQLLTKYTI